MKLAELTSAIRARIPEPLQADPRSLAACRILIGLHLIYDLATRAVDLVAHYTDAGVLPRADLPHFGRLTLPLHRLSGDAPLQILLFVIAGVLAAMLVVGYRTRIATIGSWLLLLSLHDRNPLILCGGDPLFRILLFWGMFVPLEAAWSLDRATGTPPERPDGPVVSLSVAAFFVQLVSMYLFTGLLKVEHPIWQNGTALWLALHAYDHTTALGTWMLRYPAVLTGLSFATLALEIAGPVALLVPGRPRLRCAAILAFAALQIGIAAFMCFGSFQSVSLIWLVPMLPAWFWERPLVKRVTEAAGAYAARRLPLRRRAPAIAGAAGPVGVAAEWIAVAIGLVVLYGNVASLFVPLDRDIPGHPERITYRLGIDQRWTMFCEPARATGWIVALVQQEDGAIVDVITGKRSNFAERPAVPSAVYGNWRRRSLVTYGLWRRPPQRYLDDYGAYMCRAWNGAHEGAERGAKLRVVWMRQAIADDRRELAPVKHVTLWEGDCPGDTARSGNAG